MTTQLRPRLLGADWEEQRFRQLGWGLMPLRAFLGVTFLYASLQKLANPNYLKASSPTSVVAQMKALESTSPIGGLLRLSLHAPTLVGLAIAFGELAVAVGIIAGLWTRLAAVGGMLLSLTFFLTGSWSTTPYYYGSDIVFVFAWSVFAMCGAGGVLSLDAWIDARAGASTPYDERAIDEVRRKILIGARSTGLLAVVAATFGGLAAVIGRAVGGTRHSNPQALTAGTSANPPTTSPPGTAPPHHAKAHRQHVNQGGATPPGTALAPISAVPVGQGRRFTDPRSGQPAWLLRPSSNKVAAFSAVCTHAGCTVDFDSGANEFVCPCHGGRYSARTGAVISGPPPAPLSAIPVRVVSNEIRVD